jgi:hypothetical protein
MTKTNCIFCGEFKERSKEHVWPRWLQKFVGGSTKGQHTGTHFRLPWPRPVSNRKQSGESLVLGNICKDCNNGWMSDLEIEVMPLLKDVITNKCRANTWSKIEAESIAKWSLKTSIVINLSSNYRRIIQDHLIKKFYETRSVPHSIIIDIAFHEVKEKRLEWRQSRNFAIVGTEDILSNLDHIKSSSFIIGMAINELVLRVVYWPDPRAMINPDKRKGFIQLYPYEKDIVFPKFSKLNSIESMGNSFVLYS